MANRYDDYTEGMGASAALAKTNGCMSADQVDGENVGHDHDPNNPGRGGVIQGSFINGAVDNLSGGGAGQVPYQSAADTTAMLAAGISGQVLKSNGEAPPSWVSQAPGLIVGKANGIVETGTGSLTVHMKVINIGDWNMVSDSSISVNHGLTYSKIIGLRVHIRRDDDTLVYSGYEGFNAMRWYPTYVYLSRTDTGIFNNALFDSTSYNRGFILIEYVD